MSKRLSIVEENDYEESFLVPTPSVNHTNKEMVDVLDDLGRGEVKFGRSTSEDYEGINLLKKISSDFKSQVVINRGG